MFATVAIHSPRISRMIAGGVVSGLGGLGMVMPGPDPLHAASIPTTNDRAPKRATSDDMLRNVSIEARWDDALLRPICRRAIPPMIAQLGDEARVQRTFLDGAEIRFDVAPLPHPGNDRCDVAIR